MFEDWLTEVARITGRPELNLTTDQQKQVLDLAREAAHGVARPAAPLTTFLAGYALGTEGDLERLTALVADLSTAAQARPPKDEA
ncbi:MAG TPA: DUF6457 domain-containing protein [Actinospica sp.]|jgi:hypothetical protein|nr:DUF6457 domain-containing protein [Actinospica sp.]